MVGDRAAHDHPGGDDRRRAGRARLASRRRRHRHQLAPALRPRREQPGLPASAVLRVRRGVAMGVGPEQRAGMGLRHRVDRRRRHVHELLPRPARPLRRHAGAADHPDTGTHPRAPVGAGQHGGRRPLRDGRCRLHDGEPHPADPARHACRVRGGARVVEEDLGPLRPRPDEPRPGAVQVPELGVPDHPRGAASRRRTPAARAPVKPTSTHASTRITAAGEGRRS